MYAINFINGVSPCGNDGLKRLHYKSTKGIMQELSTMRKLGGEIFIVSDFTQKMCEMSPSQLWSYCINNYKMYIRNDQITYKF